MSTVVAAISVGVLQKVVVSVITAGLSSVAKRAKDDFVRSRDPHKLDNAQIYDLLSADVVIEKTSLARLANAGKGKISATEMKRTVSSDSVTAVVQQLICAVLIEATHEKFAKIERSFKLAFLASTGLNDGDSDEIAGELFEVLEAAARAQIDPIYSEGREPIAEVLAHLILVQATVDSVEHVLASLTKFQSQPSREELENWKSLYRRQATELHGYITPPDFRDRNPVALEKIYVPGRILLSSRGPDNDAPIELYDLIPHMDRDVLLGDPGGGKSTATHALTYKLAKDPAAPLPFVVVLREFAPRSSDLSVVEFIELQLRTRYQAGAPEAAIEAVLNSGSAMVLFDGLDELLESNKRIEIAKKVEMFSSRYPLAKVFVTSRKVGYREAKLNPDVFSVHELSGYSIGDVETYVNKWFNLQSIRADEEREPLIRAFLRESSSISDLRSNPLLLALLCIIYRGQGYLPKNRIGIYEECSKLLFQSWDRSRGIVFDFTFESHIEDALKHLAYWMFNSSNSDDGVLESTLVHELATFFEERAFESGVEAKNAAADFIEFCRGRAWVLSEAGTTPEGDALFKFTHRTFMEYFAASQLTRIAPEPKKLARILLPRVSKGEWDIVGQLAIHLINRSADRGAEVALEQMINSSANRTVQYRDAVLTFIASCLDYLAIAPGLVRKAVHESMELLVQAVEEGNGMAPFRHSWTKFAYLENRSDETIEQEIVSWLTESLSSTDGSRVTAALMVIDRVPWMGFLNPSPTSSGTEKLWHDRGTEILSQRLDLLSAPGHVNDWMAEEYYSRRLIDIDTLSAITTIDPSYPLEFLFRGARSPHDVEGLTTTASQILSWIIGHDQEQDSDEGDLNRRYLNELCRDVGRIVTTIDGPITRASIMPRRTQFLALYRSEQSDWNRGDSIDDNMMKALLMMAGSYIELREAEPRRWRLKAGTRVDRFMNVLLQSRRNGTEIPIEMGFTDTEPGSTTLSRLARRWTSGELSFVKLDVPADESQ